MGKTSFYEKIAYILKEMRSLNLGISELTFHSLVKRRSFIRCLPLALTLSAASCSDSSGFESTSDSGQGSVSDATTLKKTEVDGAQSKESGASNTSDGDKFAASDSSSFSPMDAEAANVDAGGSENQIPCEEPFSLQGIEATSPDYRQGCISTVEGVEIKFFPLPAGKKVSRLALYFHGDGALDYLSSNSDALDTKMVNWAREHDVVIGALRSNAVRELRPGVTGPSFGAVGSAEAGEIYGKVVGKLLDAFHVVHRDSTLYWGVSGGPWYLSGIYIPRFGHLYPGVFVLHSGGPRSFVEPLWDFSDQSISGKISIFYNYGDKDGLLGQIHESTNYYSDLGFKVDYRELKEYGHSDLRLNINDTTISCWDTFLNGGEVPRTPEDTRTGSWTCRPQ